MFGNPVAGNLIGPGGAPPSTLDGITAQMINQILSSGKYPGLTLKSFYGERLYDTARVAAGTALPTSEFQLFSNPFGSQQTEINGTTQYTKTLIDTNMTNARQLPAGQFAWITSIQVRCTLTGQLDDTTQTGNNLGLANAPGTGSTAVAGDDVIGVNLIQAALESFIIKFNYAGTDFERGPLFLFPSRYGISGVAGGFMYVPTTAGTGIGQNEAIFNNGFGGVYTLPCVRQIDSLYQFAVALQAFNNFVPTRNFRIQVILEGLGAKSVVG